MRRRDSPDTTPNSFFKYYTKIKSTNYLGDRKKRTAM